MEDIDLVNAIPDLNKYAIYLTKDRDKAQDLVGETALRAIEIIRFNNRFVEKPAPYLKAVMRSVFYNSLRKKKIDQNNCSYDDTFMGQSLPEQTAFSSFSDLGRHIATKHLKDQKILKRFVQGDTAKRISDDLTGYKSSVSAVQSTIRKLKSEIHQFV